MPPTDPAEAAPAGPRRPPPVPGPDPEDDTLDLEIDLDLDPGRGPDPDPGRVFDPPDAGSGRVRGVAAGPAARPGDGPGGGPAGGPGRGPVGSYGDLLDGLAGWGPARTPHGVFRLVPVDPARDLSLIARWMNDPAVDAFWDLAGPEETTARHLRAQLDGDGRSAPCLGILDGRPMSYWEIYRADLDPLARHYPARPHDTGVHLVVGRVADRGHGLGGTLLRAVADLVLDHRPACARVVAEPDLRNTASVAAFLAGGFRFAAELPLPDKRAALMIRDRRLRAVL